MSTETDAFSRALENPEEQPAAKLPQDDIDTGGISSEGGEDEQSGGSSSDSASSEDESDEADAPAGPEEEEDEDDGEVGAIRSKHELAEEPAPDLPDDYEISPTATISPIGSIKNVFEHNIVIQASLSGEKRVLKEGSILCLEDHTCIGVLCEVFGKLQNPFYRVVLPASKDDRLEELKQKIGSSVCVVVPEAHWVDTFELRKFKGTDASNGYDEELPEDEQEFSDDEKEATFKKMKKEQNRRRKEGSGRSKQNENVVKRPKNLGNSSAAHELAPMKVPQSMGTVSYRSRNSRQAEPRPSPSRGPAFASQNGDPRLQQPQFVAHSPPTPAYYPQQQPLVPHSLPQQPLYQQPQQPYNYGGVPYAQQSPPTQFLQQQPPPTQFLQQNSPPPQFLQQNTPFYQGQMYSPPPQHQPPLVQQPYHFSPPAAGPSPPVQQNMQQVLQLHQLLLQQQEQQRQNQQNQQQQQQQQQQQDFNYD